MVRADGSRTILACSPEPYLAAAIRSVVPPELALIRWSQPAELELNWQRSHPWPWLVIGSGTPPPALIDLAGSQPVIGRWLGQSSLLPEGWLQLDDWPACEGWLRQLAKRSLSGLRLAPYRGLSYQADDIVLAPAIEALLAAHPKGLKPSPPLAQANALLNRRHLPFAVFEKKGWLRLQPKNPPENKCGEIKYAS